MAEPTEADRELAAALADQIESMGPAMTYRTLARAIADERERAFNEGALAGMSLVRESRAAEETGQ